MQIGSLTSLWHDDIAFIDDTQTFSYTREPVPLNHTIIKLGSGRGGGDFIQCKRRLQFCAKIENTSRHRDKIFLGFKIEFFLMFLLSLVLLKFFELHTQFLHLR